MRDQTRALLEAMAQWPWFQTTGEPIGVPNIVSVSSWDQAFSLCNGDLWANVTLQTKNRYSYEISIRNWHRGDTWNAILKELKPTVRSLVDNHATKFGIGSAEHKDFVNQVNWDICLICMETEFADIYPPILYANTLAKWYEAGHFPCGWDGPKLVPGGQVPLPVHRLYVF